MPPARRAPYREHHSVLAILFGFRGIGNQISACQRPQGLTTAWSGEGIAVAAVRSINLATPRGLQSRYWATAA